MELNKVRLGDFIEVSTANNRNLEYGSDLIRGVTTEGFLRDPKGDVRSVDLAPYKIVRQNAFVYNPSRLDLGSIARCTEQLCIVSHLYIVFYLNAAGLRAIDPAWLYMYLRRSEFMREVTFRNFGSQRPEFNFKKMSDIELPLPPIEVQRKYVAIYEAMLANQRAYERGLDDLKLTCDAKMNDLVQRAGRETLGQFVERHDVRNTDNSIKNVKGVSTQKIFREPTSKVDRNKLSNYKIVRPGWFSFVQTTHNEKCFAFAFNNTDNDIVVTSVNEVFSVDADRVDPDFLSLFFNRSEFDRYARFNSWGSARETFTWVDLQAVEIPFIPISEQKAIADVYRSWFTRKEINARLKAQLKDICPILIRGSIEEASR